MVAASLPGAAAIGFLAAMAMEIAFLLSPASSYCGVSGGLDVCIVPPSAISILFIASSAILLACSIASGIVASRGRFGAAAAFAAPGLFGFVLALVALVNSVSTHAPAPTPPAGYSWYVAGAYAGLAALVLLGVNFLLQLVRYRRKVG